MNCSQVFSGNLTHRLESTELQTSVWEMVPPGDLSTPLASPEAWTVPLRVGSFSILYLMPGLLSTTGMPGWADGAVLLSEHWGTCVFFILFSQTFGTEEVNAITSWLSGGALGWRHWGLKAQDQVLRMAKMHHSSGALHKETVWTASPGVRRTLAPPLQCERYWRTTPRNLGVFCERIQVPLEDMLSSQHSPLVCMSHYNPLFSTFVSHAIAAASVFVLVFPKCHQVS